jgi:hypothetical protein
MGSFGDVINNLYSKFILRDVLSFITPGAIVVISATYLINPNVFENHYIPWPFYIPLFGAFYFVGYAGQCFGELIGFIRFFRSDEGCFRQRLNLFSRRWRERDLLKNEREKTIDFQCITEKLEWASQHLERVVIHKQMAANSVIAVIIAGIFLGVSSCPKFVHIIVLSVITILFVVSLYWDFRDSLLAQDTIENKIIKLNEEGKINSEKVKK